MKVIRERNLANAGLKWLYGLSISQNGIVSQLYKLDAGWRLSSKIEIVLDKIVFSIHS